jgi:processive 1,2-diacylglycerol beta-glucosyltransferase
VLAGRNKGLLADLSSEPEAGKRLHPVAFTDRVHELVSVACMMITKPGGVTTAECLSRGVPMVLLKPVPGQEGGNAKFFQREGAAVLTKNLRQVVQTVRRLLEEPAELERLSENARRLYKPGTRTIVEAVARMISSRTPGGS